MEFFQLSTDCINEWMICALAQEVQRDVLLSFFFLVSFEYVNFVELKWN